MRPTWLEVDHGALRANLRLAVRLAGSRAVWCVVKADAYGHGLVPVATTFAAAGAHGVAVATVAEGMALRTAGFQLPILLLGGYLGDEAPEIVAHGLTPTVFDPSQIEPLATASRAVGKNLAIHAKIDTGMGRIGASTDAAVAFVAQIAAVPELTVEGVFSHFAEANLADSPAASRQVERLAAVRAGVGTTGVSVPQWHLANSAALMRGLETEHATAGADAWTTHVRPGIMLYGAAPAAGFVPPEPLHPAATWKARVVQAKNVAQGTRIGYCGDFTAPRESRIATLPVGYADGYPRRLSNCGRVLVQGMEAPVVGRVCMDMVMIDVTDVPDPVMVGDEVVLMGRQQNAEISAEAVGGNAGGIAYDFLCGISARVPRVHVGVDAAGDGG